MKRKQFLRLLPASLAALGCRYDNGETNRRVLLLEVHLSTELLFPGDYKINSTVGLFVRRRNSGFSPQDFDCFWMICTHARCTVVYKPAAEQFSCPCYGSLSIGTDSYCRGLQPTGCKTILLKSVVNG